MVRGSVRLSPWNFAPYSSTVHMRRTDSFQKVPTFPVLGLPAHLIELAVLGHPIQNKVIEGTMRILSGLLQDLRYALRQLSKNRGFTAVAVVTLTLGIGANTAIFSAINAILLRPPPYPEPSQVVSIDVHQHFAAAGVIGYGGLSLDAWKEIQAKSSAIGQLGTYKQSDFTLTGAAEPEKLRGTKVSGDFFSVFGTPPLLGRLLPSSDSEQEHARLAVLSYTLWHTVFGSDPAILGRKIFLDQEPYTVIGVMPPEFRFGVDDRGAWIPETDQSPTNAVARLKPNITFQQADAQLKVMGMWFAAKHPKIFQDSDLTVSPIEQASDETRNGLMVLLWAVGFVLLIACANVSGLLLARGNARLQEISIRKALGATRVRVIRQLLLESILLSLCGGGLAVIFSRWGIQALRAIAPSGTPNLDHMRVEPLVLVFALGVSLFTGILFGIAPALQLSGNSPFATIPTNLGSASAGLSLRRSHRLLRMLVVVEVALAVILGIGATLASRSFESMMSIKPGFRTDHTLSFSIDFSSSVCHPQKKEQIANCEFAIQGILDRIRAIPGVQSAAFASSVPLNGADGVLSLRIEGQHSLVGIQHGTLTLSRFVSPDYFQTMSIPILAGRAFGKTDGHGSQEVAIVNEMFAREYLSGKPLGHRIKRENMEDNSAWAEIVGEVRDSRDFSLFDKPAAEYYIPAAQASFLSGTNFLVRTTIDPFAILTAVRQRIRDLDRNAPITDIKTMDQVVAEQVVEPRFRTLLLTSFGLLALVLAVVGIYGVISYTVVQRTHEIGIRMALGAKPGQILRMVIHEGMLFAGFGLAVGIAGALVLTRFLESLLFAIKPTDPASFLGVSILLAAVVLLACYIPARRAAKVDPMVALRYE